MLFGISLLYCVFATVLEILPLYCDFTTVYALYREFNYHTYYYIPTTI